MKIFTKTKFVMLALVALAIFAPQKSNASVFGISGNFCSRIPTIEEKVLAQVETFQTKREENKPILSIKLEEAWTADKAELALDRASADERRALQIDALMAKAETDGEKKAVTEFEKKANKAVKDLRISIDKATLTYQTSVKDLRDERLSGLDESIAAYKIKIQTSFATIAEDCQNSNETEKTLKAEVEALRNGLKKDQETYENKLGSIDTFAETRANTIVKAEATYAKEMKSAETLLRKALKQ